MPRKPQIVGDLTFKTKKELHEYTKKFLEENGVCEIDNLDKDKLLLTIAGSSSLDTGPTLTGNNLITLSTEAPAAFSAPSLPALPAVFLTAGNLHQFII